MLTLKLLFITLMSSIFFLKVFADDPGFCNNEPVCKPCNCNSAGKCQGFCHHDKGNSGPKHCDLNAQGCQCPPGSKALAGASFLERRGGCMSVGGRGGGGGGKIGAEPHGSCGQYNGYYACVYTAPYYCRWIGNTCVDIRGTGQKKAPAKKDPTKKAPTKKDPTKKAPTKKAPSKKVPT
ncbi:hypothetical protein CH63R_01495 [Colletotrichum higginsianum IMI 349063]|uniref:Uncharacterized protein n=2 Tax=Colletotrichum higginsianum TaxID=80884 RepID=A0A1B7YW84_COLHI|nr:hypothetical protein CH63R_01495 [Colletotrichum higginsianum IMI 349063]OBR16315.1 hypothetical protein CH63R_01495 [Colletotrichum higginsianum IMI 349063]TID03869.1 hypothetical protein CH35J_001984 [Colletotrichum higginsianum]